jgi:hypothetical protein
MPLKPGSPRHCRHHAKGGPLMFSVVTVTLDSYAVMAMTGASLVVLMRLVSLPEAWAFAHKALRQYSTRRRRRGPRDPRKGPQP